MNKYFNKQYIKQNAKSYIMILSLFFIGIVFSVLTDGIFISSRNLSNLARQTAVVGVISIAMMFVIIAGHIDLSIGSVLGCCGTIAAVLQVWLGWSTPSTIIAVVLIGVLIGAWQGFWVSYRNVPAFIVTLGGLLIFKGVKLGISKSMSISPMQPSFSIIGQGYLPASVGWIIAFIAIVVIVISTLKSRKSKEKYNIETSSMTIDILKMIMLSFFVFLTTFIFNSYQGIPVPVLILISLGILFYFIANNTTYGRSIYSIGGNLEASTLAGIKTKRIVMYMFMLTGALAAFAGIILTARLDAATSAAGDSMELDAIAACVVGGVSMVGGVGKISGVLIGALIMAALDNGMSLINLENFWQFIVKGLVLIVAVWADMSLNNDKKC